jgi:hypothetical protein
LIWRAFALVYVRLGWQIHVEPGQELELRKGGDRMQPSQVLGVLATDGPAAQAWAGACAQSGLAELRLWPEAEGA